MKTDTQHLDYLISQYVDGCLDTSSRKSLEQKLVHDPVARQSYKEQRDVQDVLDDWGNRIPMIDWDDFDKKLAGRLEREVVGGRRVSTFQRWARPLSAAAALFLAASGGYLWHAWSNAPAASPTVATVHPTGPSLPSGTVVIEANKLATANTARVTINDAPADEPLSSAPARVAISSPEDMAAANSLNEAVTYGLQMPGIARAAMPQLHPLTTGTAMGNEKEMGPAFP